MGTAAENPGIWHPASRRAREINNRRFSIRESVNLTFYKVISLETFYLIKEFHGIRKNLGFLRCR